MTTPLKIAVEPNKIHLTVKDYNFEEQVRRGLVSAGRHTNNSIQTFNSSGKPTDAQSDKND